MHGGLGAFLVARSRGPVASFGNRRLSQSTGPAPSLFRLRVACIDTLPASPRPSPRVLPPGGCRRGHDRSGFLWSRPGSIVAWRVGQMALEELVALLRCPRCHRSVRIDGPGVVCEGPSMHRFATQDGALVAFPEDRDVVTMPVDHVSNQIDGEVLDWLDSLPGYSLNLGAGATTRRPSRCVELEYSVFVNTTVVGDAHQLPFEDDVFDAVVSYNTFEHLADPAAAASEIYRVLKPGGSLRLQTAFLQPLHEEPAHFYNSDRVRPPALVLQLRHPRLLRGPRPSPSRMFAWLSNHILYHVEQCRGPEVHAMVGAMKLSQWARFWSEPRTRVGFIPVVFNLLPMETRAHFSAGFELRGARRRKRHRGARRSRSRSVSTSERPAIRELRFREVRLRFLRGRERPSDVIAFQRGPSNVPRQRAPCGSPDN